MTPGEMQKALEEILSATKRIKLDLGALASDIVDIEVSTLAIQNNLAAHSDHRLELYRKSLVRTSEDEKGEHE